MAIQALDRAVEVTRARMKAEGGLLATVALALIGVPSMLMQVVIGRAPKVEQAVFDRTVELPDPTALDGLAFLALLLALMLGQLTVARMMAVSEGTVRDALAVAGRRFLPFLGASLIIGAIGTGLIVLVSALLALLSLLGGPGLMLAVVLVVLAFVAFVVVYARLQMLVPEVVRSGDGPLAMLRSVWSRSKGLTASLVVLLIVVFLLGWIVPGAAQLLLSIPTTLLAGVDAGLVAGAIASGLVGSIITMFALSLAVAVHAQSGARSGPDERDVRGGGAG